MEIRFIAIRKSIYHFERKLIDIEFLICYLYIRFAGSTYR